MPKGPRVLIDNACYHVTARGNQQQPTFRQSVDYEEMLQRVYHYKGKFNLKIYAYCFMPNHIHFLAHPHVGKDLSKFMQGFLRSYTKFFNDKYSLVGHLWQDRFKSKIIDNENYLLDCLAYIENNPVRSKIVNNALDYQWSSSRERNLSGWNKKPLINKFLP